MRQIPSPPGEEAYSALAGGGRPASSTEWTYSRDGEEVIPTFKSGGVLRFPPLQTPLGAYRGYLCR